VDVMPVIFFIIVPMLCIISSLTAIVSPEKAWYYQEGWKYKNVEPSDRALISIRISGIIGVVCGIVFIVVTQTIFSGLFAGFP
jgi:hypothetical protein